MTRSENVHIPKPHRHNCGRARVLVRRPVGTRRPIYLGPWGSRQAAVAYARLAAELAAGTLPAGASSPCGSGSRTCRRAGVPAWSPGLLRHAAAIDGNPALVRATAAKEASFTADQAEGILRAAYKSLEAFGRDVAELRDVAYYEELLADSRRESRPRSTSSSSTRHPSRRATSC